jgi:Rieske Fe-S protein
METPAPDATVPRTRRDFLADVVLGTGTALGLGGLAFRFLQYLYPVVLPVKMVEVAAGNAGDIPAGGVQLVHLAEGPVMLQKTGNEVRALSAVCTHLGCIIQWDARAGKFVCPCHHGMYDVDGKVISGPPPRPLDKFEVKLRDGQVFVVMPSLKEEAV